MSISIYTNLIPRRMVMTAWKMCAHAVMALTMLVLSRVAGTTTITIMITRCHRCHHSLVPRPALEAAVALHSLINNSNSNSNNSNSHPDRSLPLGGLSVPENPTEPRIPVMMAQVEEVAYSPGPSGRAKNLHQYDRRFLYFRSSFPPVVLPFSSSPSY